MIAPLDWGLGHATRCIPIIRVLQQNGCQIIVAASSMQKELLEKELINIRFIDLKSYNIYYSKHRWNLGFIMFRQLKKINTAIKNEHTWLQKIIEIEKINVVISDNRYGLYSTKIPCVLMTHQLRIAAAFSWIEKFLQRINYRYIQQFTECWVPDFSSEKNLAGKLSHPKLLPTTPVFYMGTLSRFIPTSTITQIIQYNACFLLSGPEPQRTLLEQKLIQQAAQLPEKNFLLVRGLPNAIVKIQFTPNVKVVNHLNEQELLQAISGSSFIISRSGYTTVMEMMTLQKKCIFIPTPGQTEQEYLATHLQHQQYCLSYQQSTFHLDKALKIAENFSFQFPQLPSANLQTFIIDFLQRIA